MRTSTLALAIGFACISACAPTEDLAAGPEADIAQLGFSEFPLTGEPGYISFYIGKAVLEEVARTGTFVPSPAVTYSVIRISESKLAGLDALLDPIVLSLCEADNDITLFHNDVSRVYVADPPGSNNCTPWVTRTDGRMTIEYHSGQDGVYGSVQVGRLPNGNLFAGASMTGLLRSVCPENPTVGNSSMTLGSLRLAGANVEGCSAPSFP